MKEDIEILEQELNSRYNGNEINVEFKGAVDLFFNIENLKSFVSQQTVVLSNGIHKELMLKVDMFTGLEITDDSIIIDMFDNYSVTLVKVDNAEDIEEETGGDNN